MQLFVERAFAGAVRDQMKSVDHAPLSDAIDAADPLLEAHGIPRQLEIDHDAAASVEVQALSGGICGEQESCAAIGERVYGRSALSS